MYDIIFFTSNVGKGGLDIENLEEIKQLKKSYELLILPFICIKNIKNIIKNGKEIIYIDFINCDISLLNNLNLITNKLIYKYKGRLLNDDIIKIISKTSNSTIYILTTCINEDIYNIKFIKYWSLNLNTLKSINNINTIKYQENFLNIKNTNYFKFMFVGRSSYNKGILQTVNAFKKYLTINKECILILITIGNIYIDKCDNIYNFINVDYNDCLYMIKNYCDCLIMASDNEGFGRVAIEALYYKKLLISTINTMLYDLMPENKGIYYLINNDEDTIYNALLNVNKLTYDKNITHNFINYLQNSFDNLKLFFINNCF